MGCSMNLEETRVRSGKLASWWRHWRERGVMSGRGCDVDVSGHLADVEDSKRREPHVLAGKWPADPISWDIEGVSTVDRM